MNVATPTMTINGVLYIEQATPLSLVVFNACSGCVFDSKPKLCGIAIDGAAKEAFGGDCQQRDVIYAEASDA